MSTEENKAIARRFFEEIVNAKQLGVADEIFSAEHTYHDPSSPMIGPGPEGQKQLIGAYICQSPAACTNPSPAIVHNRRQ